MSWTLSHRNHGASEGRQTAEGGRRETKGDRAGLVEPLFMRDLSGGREQMSDSFPFEAEEKVARSIRCLFLPEAQPSLEYPTQPRMMETDNAGSSGRWMDWRNRTVNVGMMGMT